MLTATSHLAGSAAPALPQSDPTPRKPRRRAGIAALWIVLVLPLLVLLIFFAVNIGNQWNARVELENSLEAAALAAVKEWAEGPSGSTLPARLVGQQYAAANYIGNCPVHIGLNHDPDTGGVNENDECCLPDGHLIFGAAIPIDPNDPDGPLKFDAGVRPSCGVGKVLFDASAQGQSTSDDNWWGVAFFRTEDTPDGLRIKRITYDLRAGGDNGFFDSPPILSDNLSPHKVRVGNANNPSAQQEDIVGLDDRALASNSQITWSFNDPDDPWRLTFEFSDGTLGDGTTPDDGFEPCDRFRFGVQLENVGPDSGGGNGRNDGDAVGGAPVIVEVVFELGGQELDPVYATFEDTTHSKDCAKKPEDVGIECCGGTAPDCSDGVPMMIVHPAGIANLPCPPSSAAGNNGQSYIMLQGGGSNKFAVRAHAKVPVPNLMSNFCGIGCGPSYVTACTTAIYDCSEGRPRLVRIDKFICPGPEETPDP